MRIRIALASYLSLVLASSSFANVYVVDVHGGPGVDFTDIPPAVAAAHAGDVLRVHAGQYTNFVLTSGISVLCDSATYASFDIASIPAGQRAVVSGITLTYFASHPAATVSSCIGPVFLESITGNTGAISIQASTDVRLRACTNVSVSADGSRVEITGSSLRGRGGEPGCEGTDCNFPGSHYEGYPGGAALTCVNAAIVHVGASSITGGSGGAGGDLSFGPNYPGGNGGDALVTNCADVLVTGTGSESIVAGSGGTGQSDPFSPPAASGAPGNALDAQCGSVLESNVSTVGNVVTAQGTVTTVAPADPCLTISGSGVAGTQLVYTVHGQSGDQARLRLGRQFVVNHLPNVFEDQLTIALRSYSLGILPASGQASFTLTVPTSLPPGFVIVAQASTTDPAGQTRLTQSVPVAVR